MNPPTLNAVAIRYRAFRNSDPPALAEIWRARTQERGLMQPMSGELFEQLVLSKPYFDNAGLIVAEDQGKLVGFVHAAFGPADDQQNLSRRVGVTCMLMVRPEYRRLGIGKQLLLRSEAYLQGRGAQTLLGGGMRPMHPFYLGLYGGSEMPGVLDSDVQAQKLYAAIGYRQVARCLVLHRDLNGFRPPVNRQQMQIRRKAKIQVLRDPPAANWWDACSFGNFERTRYDLVECDAGPAIATATFWTMEPLSTSWGVRAVGLINFEVSPARRREGLASYLLCEAFRQLHEEGVQLVEAQTPQENEAAKELYLHLGFQIVDQGAVFQKDLAAVPTAGV